MHWRRRRARWRLVRPWTISDGLGVPARRWRSAAAVARPARRHGDSRRLQRQSSLAGGGAARLALDRVAKWLVLGDMRELGPVASELHAQSGQEARTTGFERLYALGEHSRAAAAAFGEDGRHFTDLEALVDALSSDLEHHAEPPTILIKGSRGMRMERVVAVLAEPEETGVKPEGQG